jgi:hypothetical protein
MAGNIPPKTIRKGKQKSFTQEVMELADRFGAKKYSLERVANRVIIKLEF